MKIYIVYRQFSDEIKGAYKEEAIAYKVAYNLLKSSPDDSWTVIESELVE